MLQRTLCALICPVSDVWILWILLCLFGMNTILYAPLLPFSADLLDAWSPIVITEVAPRGVSSSPAPRVITTEIRVLNMRLVRNDLQKSFIPTQMTYVIQYVREEGSCLETVSFAAEKMTLVAREELHLNLPPSDELIRLTQALWSPGQVLRVRFSPAYAAWQKIDPAGHHDIIRSLTIVGTTNTPAREPVYITHLDYFDARRGERLQRYQVAPCEP